MGGINSGRKKNNVKRHSIFLDGEQMTDLDGIAHRINNRGDRPKGRKVTASSLIRYAISRLIKELK